MFHGNPYSIEEFDAKSYMDRISHARVCTHGITHSGVGFTRNADNTMRVTLIRYVLEDSLKKVLTIPINMLV